MSASQGSITGFYTVLVEGDGPNEPIADAVRSVVDGHVLLNRDLAARGQYPAVDLLGSTSRVMMDVIGEQHRINAQRFSSTLAIYQEAEDLINIGAYIRGSNPRIDYALSKIDDIIEFIKQPLETGANLAEAEHRPQEIFADYPETHV